MWRAGVGFSRKEKNEKGKMTRIKKECERIVSRCKELCGGRYDERLVNLFESYTNYLADDSDDDEAQWSLIDGLKDEDNFPAVEQAFDTLLKYGCQQNGLKEWIKRVDQLAMRFAEIQDAKTFDPPNEPFWGQSPPLCSREGLKTLQIQN